MDKALSKSATLVAEGNLLTERGELQQAIPVYISALESDLNNHLGFYHLGLCLAKQKRFNEAISFYNYAASINPDFPQVYYALGEVLFSQKKIDKAIACYQKAISLNPDLPHFYMALAKAFKKKERYLLALSCYQKVIDLKPDFFWAYIQLGAIFRQHGRYPQAVDCYIKAIEINPKFESAYTILEFIPIAEEQLEKLIAVYQKIVENHPDIYQAWTNLGNALTKKQDLPQALKAYQQACYHKTIVAYPQLAQSYPQVINNKEPNFIVIGASKCGTTSLYKYLSQHSKVIPPINKEIDFFNFNYKQGKEWYLAHFPVLPKEQDFITGEASPSYFYNPNVDRRIRELMPQIKLIVLLRNPVERVISHYHHRIREGAERDSLETALNSELKIIKKATPAQLSYIKGYLGISLYIYKLRRWLSSFPSEQFLIIQSENLYRNPSEIMSQTYNFLNINQQDIQDYTQYNSGSYKLKNDLLTTQLTKFFKPYNQQLEALLNRKFDWS